MMPTRASGDVRVIATAAIRDPFDAVQKHIVDGNYYQLNLTVRFCSETRAKPRKLLQQFLQNYHAQRALYIEGMNQAIISLSPETFFILREGKIMTQPIKGTRPRSSDALIDERERASLETNEKERAELSMITDLLRNDLSIVSQPGSVIVEDSGTIIETPSVWHRASRISGSIRPGMNRIDVLSSLIPGGSITGCPKRSAMEGIERLETSSRGFFTGCGIILTPASMEASILIRTIEYVDGQCTLGIGGGIVYDANVHDEYDEIYQKAAPFLARQYQG